MRNLAPGYRFYPTEEELIGFYLRHKLERTRDDFDRVIPVHDIFSLDPWQLPSISGELCSGDVEQWFFFSPRQERETRGGRPNRITPSGYWKATGSPGCVYSGDNRFIGLKKTMVFYEGKAPRGKKTKWKVNEYRALEEDITSGATPKLRNEFSLCRVYVKSGCLRSFDRRPTTSNAVTNIENRRTTFPMDSCDIASASSSNLGASSHENLVKAEINSSVDVEETVNADWKMMNNLETLLDLLDWD